MAWRVPSWRAGTDGHAYTGRTMGFARLREDIATIRERDSMTQERVALQHIPQRVADLVEGVTAIEKVDEVTGLSRKIVIESRAADLRPRITIINPATGTVQYTPDPGFAGTDSVLLAVGIVLLLLDAQRENDLVATILTAYKRLTEHFVRYGYIPRPDVTSRPFGIRSMTCSTAAAPCHVRPCGPTSCTDSR